MNNYPQRVRAILANAFNYCIDSDDTLGTGYSFKRTQQPLIIDKATQALTDLITEAQIEELEKVRRANIMNQADTELDLVEIWIDGRMNQLKPKTGDQ